MAVSEESGRALCALFERLGGRGGGGEGAKPLSWVEPADCDGDVIWRRAVSGCGSQRVASIYQAVNGLMAAKSQRCGRNRIFWRGSEGLALQRPR